MKKVPAGGGDDTQSEPQQWQRHPSRARLGPQGTHTQGRRCQAGAHPHPMGRIEASAKAQWSLLVGPHMPAAGNKRPELSRGTQGLLWAWRWEACDWQGPRSPQALPSPPPPRSA